MRLFFALLLVVKLPYDPVCPSVGWSVCHNFFLGREGSLPCFYRSTCLFRCHFQGISYFEFDTLSLVLKEVMTRTDKVQIFHDRNTTHLLYKLLKREDRRIRWRGLNLNKWHNTFDDEKWNKTRYNGVLYKGFVCKYRMMIKRDRRGGRWGGGLWSFKIEKTTIP